MNIYSLFRGHLFRASLHNARGAFVFACLPLLGVRRMVPDCMKLAPCRDGGERESSSRHPRFSLSLAPRQQDTSHPPGKTPTRIC